MKVNINLIGVEELSRLIKDKQKDMQRQLPDQLRDAVLFLQGQIKTSIAHGTNAPVTVDTGRFLNSIDFDSMGDNSARVFTDLEYAKFLEFGTSKMDARPHFRNTLFVNQDNITYGFNNRLNMIFS